MKSKSRQLFSLYPTKTSTLVCHRPVFVNCIGEQAYIHFWEATMEWYAKDR